MSAQGGEEVQTFLAGKLQILTFELTQENKSCSPCPKDQHKHVTDADIDTVTATLVPSFCHVDIF